MELVFNKEVKDFKQMQSLKVAPGFTVLVGNQLHKFSEYKTWDFVGYLKNGEVKKTMREKGAKPRYENWT